MTPTRRTSPRLHASAVLALVAVMLALPVSAPLCASALGVCALPTAAAPPVGAHCPMAAAMEGMGDGADMDCCVSDAAPQEPAPAVPGPSGKVDGERSLQTVAGLAPVPASLAFATPALPAPAPEPTANLAASPVPLYTLLSSLLS